MDVSPGVVIASAPWATPYARDVLEVVAAEQAVDEPRGERVAAADAVEDLEPAHLGPGEERLARAADAAPVVDGRGVRLAQGRRDEREVGVAVEDLPVEALVGGDVEVRMRLVDPLERVAERRREVLLVAEQDVDLLDELPVGLGRRFGTAARLPQRRAVVEVERDDRPVTACGGHRLERERRGVRRERREDPAAVEPAGAAVAEDRVPVDVSRLHRRRRRVSAIRGPESRPDAEAALDEVQAVADASPDAVVGEPRDVRGVDASLEDQVLEQAADRVVGERRDDRGAEPEAPAEPARDVVLAASLGDRKRARGRDATVARVEAEHDLAERHEVVAAVLGRT